MLETPRAFLRYRWSEPPGETHLSPGHLDLSSQLGSIRFEGGLPHRITLLNNLATLFLQDNEFEGAPYLGRGLALTMRAQLRQSARK